MVTILPVAEEVAANLAHAEGLSMPLAAFVLQTGAGREGYVLYREDEDNVTLLAVRAPDGALEEGLVRAALHAAYERGVKRAWCGNEGLQAVLKRLQFDEPMWSCDLREFFSRPCHGKTAF